MDGRPIGVFDSGLGGLSGVSRLKELMPNETIIYLGDTARMPYGEKTEDEILKFTAGDIEFLLKQDVKAIFAACGTISAVALPLIKYDYEVPVFDAILPPAKKAAELSENRVVGIIATSATIRRGSMHSALRAYGPDIEVIDSACPKFAPLVESGITSPGSSELKAAMHEYLAGIKAAGADTLILGCTHYSFLRDAIVRYLGEDVILVGAAEEGAVELFDYLNDNDLRAFAKVGQDTYYTSSEPERFAGLAEKMLGAPLDGRVLAADL